MSPTRLRRARSGASGPVRSSENSRSVGRSAIYEGTVVHARSTRGGHRFEQAVQMVLVDLERVDELCRAHPLWSSRGLAPVWFRRADFLGDPSVPLLTAVRDLVELRTGSRPLGPVTLLTNPRTWGWLSNPVSFYFCFDAAGQAVEYLVAEVTNTPWQERHCYVVGAPGVHELTKALHVSPFLGMDQSYLLDYSEPDERLHVRFEVRDPDGPQLVAGLTLVRRAPDRRSLGKLVWSPGRGSIGVSFGIYRQAFALWRKRTRIYRHPDRGATPLGDPGRCGCDG